MARYFGFFEVWEGNCRVVVNGCHARGCRWRRRVVIENLTFYGSTLPAQPAQELDDRAPLSSPYPGLAYFGPQHSALFFFGRDSTIAQLQIAVMRHAMRAFVGDSGSGKSSVVLAGLARVPVHPYTALRPHAIVSAR